MISRRRKPDATVFIPLVISQKKHTRGRAHAHTVKSAKVRQTQDESTVISVRFFEID